MKISYKPSEKKNDVLTLLIDGEPWKDVHIVIFGRRPKLPKEAASLKEWQEMWELLEYQRVKNYALRRLSVQGYHSFLLKKLLLERLVQPILAQKIIEELSALGYLDDQAWLESFMRSQLKRYGVRAIMAKLQAKGFSSEYVQKIAQQWRNPIDEQQTIERLLQTRYRSKDIKQFKDKQKIIASLLRKGYPFDSIQAALLKFI